MNKTERIIAAVATMAFGVLLIVLQGKFIGLLMTVAGICLIVWGVLDFLHHLIPPAVIKIVAAVSSSAVGRWWKPCYISPRRFC